MKIILLFYYVMRFFPTTHRALTEFCVLFDFLWAPIFKAYFSVYDFQQSVTIRPIGPILFIGYI